MTDIEKKGAELAKAGKLGELMALIEEQRKVNPVTAFRLGPLIESAYNNQKSGGKR